MVRRSMNHNREFAFWQRVNVTWLGSDRGILNDMARLRRNGATAPLTDSPNSPYSQRHDEVTDYLRYQAKRQGVLARDPAPARADD
jgi:hypothetical protein